MMPRSASSQSGVTLIETLVALFVIALMATAGAMMTAQAVRGARAVEDKGAGARDLGIALGLLAGDLAAAQGRTFQSPEMTEPPVLFEGFAPRHDGRLMRFVRNGWANPGESVRSDLQLVEYVFERGRLIRRSWSAPDPGGQTPYAEQVLVSGLEALRARYGREANWQETWTLLPSDQTPGPQKVEITLTYSEGDEVRAEFLIGAGQ